MIEKKVNVRDYSSLAEFIGDVTKIFENVRYFNPGGTNMVKAAENLEQFLVKQIGPIRDKLAHI